MPRQECDLKASHVWRGDKQCGCLRQQRECKTRTAAMQQRVPAPDRPPPSRASMMRQPATVQDKLSAPGQVRRTRWRSASAVYRRAYAERTASAPSQGKNTRMHQSLSMCNVTQALDRTLANAQPHRYLHRPTGIARGLPAGVAQGNKGIALHVQDCTFEWDLGVTS